MKETDVDFALVPQKANNRDKYLIKMLAKIPSVMSKFRVYFNRVRAKTEGGRVYLDAFVQHSVPIDDVKGGAE